MTAISELRIDHALSASVALKAIPTVTGRGAVPKVAVKQRGTFYYWLDSIADVAGNSSAFGDGNLHASYKPGKKLAGGGYQRAELGGSKQSAATEDWGLDGILSDEEAVEARESFNLDRQQQYTDMLAQNLSLNIDREFRRLLDTNTFTSGYNGARAGVFTASTVAQGYIKTTGNSAVNAIRLASGYTGASIKAYVPYDQALLFQSAPELNERNQYSGVIPAQMGMDQFAQFLANFWKIKKVEWLDSVGNTARLGVTAAGGSIFDGDDILWAVDNGDGNPNNGVFWGWAPPIVGQEKAPESMQVAASHGRNPLDQFETFRIDACGTFAVNLPLCYLTTSISA